MKTKTKYLLKKYLPYAVLLIATAALMLFFKQSSFLNEYVGEGKSSLIKYYTENLKPLFFRTEITNEDVFNFALHKNLPIDKENKKLLQINNDEEKGKSFTLEQGVWKSKTNNFEKYVNYLQLNENQAAELDSILSLYKEDLYTSILLNDSNTIAVSPTIYHLQKAIYGDLLNFTESLKNIKTDLAAEKNELFNHEKVIGLIEEQNKTGEFIVFAEDTVFETVCNYDRRKIKAKLAAAKGNLDKLRSNLKLESIINDDKLNVAVNSDELKDDIIFKISNGIKTAYVPESFTSSFTIPEMGKFSIGITGSINSVAEDAAALSGDSLLQSFVISISNSFDDEVEEKLEFEFNIKDVDNLKDEDFNYAEKLNLEEWAEFGLRIDSLANSFEFQFDDSAGGFDYSKFKVDMKKFKKVIKQNTDKLNQKVKADEKY